MRALQSNPVDPRPTSSVTAIDLDLQPILQQAVVDAGWKQEALASRLGKDPSYLSLQLNGKKPLSLDELERYPSEILAAFLARLNGQVLGSIETLVDAAETFAAASQHSMRVLRLFTPSLKRRMATASREQAR